MVRSNNWRGRAAAIVLLVQSGWPAPAAAQAPAAQASVPPWSVEATHDRATATNQGTRGLWTTDRLQLGWVRPEAGGWFLSTDRQTRGPLLDTAVALRGYRRLGDWTAAAGASVAPASDFLSRMSVDVEVSRRLVRTLVASTAYRYLDFRRLDVHQVQPALTWYHRRGEVESRLYLSHNTATGRTSPTLQIRAAYQARRRLQLAGGLAYGDRIFDIASLPSGTSHSRVGFASVRVGLTSRDSLSVGGASAHEDPAFEYRSLSVGYRRAF